MALFCVYLLKYQSSSTIDGCVIGLVVVVVVWVTDEASGGIVRQIPDDGRTDMSSIALNINFIFHVYMLLNYWKTPLSVPVIASFSNAKAYSRDQHRFEIFI